MKKIQFARAGVVISIALSQLTPALACQHDLSLVNNKVSLTCSNAVSGGTGGLNLNSAGAGAGNAFLSKGTVSAVTTGRNGSGSPVCTITDSAPKDSFAVVQSVNCPGAVSGRLVAN